MEFRKHEVVSRESTLNKIDEFLLRFSRVPMKEKLFFVQYLGIMVKAGISLSQALETLAKQTKNQKFARIIRDVSINVEKGVNLTESLRPHKNVFGELFINMIEAGEMSGQLEEVLGQLYVQMKKRNEILSKVKGAMIYPVIILVAMFGIGTFMMVVVLPQLLSILKDFGTALPLPTRIFIAFSEAINNHGLLTLATTIAFVVGMVQLWRTRRGKYAIEAVILRIPMIGGIVKKIQLANFSRTLSSLLMTDILIIKSFQITANTMSNLHYRYAINDMSERIKKGSQINEIMSAYPVLFPPVVDQMMSVGEQTGELDGMLGELADFYENEVDQVMDNLPSIIEPILILVLGAGVGIMAVAIIMPIYNLTASI